MIYSQYEHHLYKFLLGTILCGSFNSISPVFPDDTSDKKKMLKISIHIPSFINIHHDGRQSLQLMIILDLLVLSLTFTIKSIFISRRHSLPRVKFIETIITPELEKISKNV